VGPPARTKSTNRALLIRNGDRPIREPAKRRLIGVHGNQRTIAFLLALVSTLALACASATPSARGTAAIEECFLASRVRSFSSLDERFVYLRVRSNEHYLLTVDSVYTSLPFATGITISGTFSRVCSDTGAVLTYATPQGQFSSRIVRVESVASKEAALKLVEERTGRKPEH
jgi:hypothetical protein